MPLKRTVQWLNFQAIKSVDSFGAQYDAFSVFIFVFYLANPLKWASSGPYSFSIILLLRAVAVILWILLLIWRWWPKSCKTYLSMFWYFALLYHLPFRTTFSLLYSKHSPSFDSFGLLGIVALALLVGDKAFCFLTLLGSALGCLVYFAFGGLSIPLMKTMTLLYAALMVVSIAFIKLIFFRNHYVSLTEKIRANRIFAGAIAHEVRAPLSTIMLSCENGDLETTKTQAKRALSIVDSVLMQIKYFERGKTANRAPISLQKVIEDACSDDYFSDKDRLKITLDLSKDHLVLVDQLLLTQVSTNLIKNALWAIKKSGNGFIKISTEKKADDVIITFQDTGIGIDPIFRKKLFEPFHSSKENGAGMGLAFCKLALKNMGGSIECDCKTGDYTRFIVRLKSANEAMKETLNELSPSMLVSNYDGGH